jgi:hypothetical protein
MRKDRGSNKWMVVAVSLLVVWTCVLAGACAFPQAPGQNALPSVTITEPASGASVLADSYISVSASAFGDIPITRVELWLDGELVDTQESSVVGGISPFDVSFNLLVPQGAHTLFVRAVNATGLIENSPPVNVSGVENPGAREESLSPGTISTPEVMASPVAPTPATESPEPVESLSPGTISTPEATASPVAPTPTTESREPVEISLLVKERRVPTNTPIVLRFGWETDTSEQVADFLSSVELVVTVDGELVPDAGEYWSEIEESRDRDQNGQANYQTVWLHPVGVLTPGRHQVESELRFQRPVTDGFDSNGDGVPDEYSGTMRFSLQIVAGE